MIHIDDIPWIDCGLPFDGKTYSMDEDTFCQRGLNLPGTQIEVGGDHYLIGDINGLGGVCDDCCEVHSSDIVTRYRVLLPFPSQESK